MMDWDSEALLEKKGLPKKEVLLEKRKPCSLMAMQIAVKAYRAHKTRGSKLTHRHGPECSSMQAAY